MGNSAASRIAFILSRAVLNHDKRRDVPYITQNSTVYNFKLRATGKEENKTT